MLMSGWGKRCLADQELRMLYSHGWWKRSEQRMPPSADASREHAPARRADGSGRL
jgi:hypothetical protein